MRRNALRGVAAALGLIAVACSTKTPPPPPAHRRILVTHGDIRFVPDTPLPQRIALTDEMTSVLHTLYAGAFIRPKPTGPTPAPDDASTRRIATMFTPAARVALEHRPDVFQLGPHLDLLTGYLEYSGGMTRDADVTTALLSVHFTGTGSRTDEGVGVVLVDQKGQVTLQKTKAGWLVRDFALQIGLKPVPPTPTPT